MISLNCYFKTETTRKMEYVLATLKKPSNGDWYVYYSYRNPSTGKLEPFKIRGDINRIKGPKEKKEYGTNMATDINARLKNGWCPFEVAPKNPLTRLNILQLFDEFLKIKKASLRHRSYQHYKYAVDLATAFFELHHRKEMMPADFTTAMAQSFADYLIVDKEFGGRSHNNQVQSMRTFFNMMVERDIVVKNPFRLIKDMPVDVGRNIAYSDKQRKELKDYLEKNNKNMLMMVQFTYYCFIRPNELMQLQIKHIDFSGKQIQIPAHISKNRKQSSVEIPDTFFKEVNVKYSKLDPEFYIFGKGLVPGPISVHRNRATETHKKILKELGYSSEYTLYSWKHCGACAAIKSGMNPYTLMRQLRHHSLEQTMGYLKTLGLTSNSEFSLKQPKF